MASWRARISIIVLATILILLQTLVVPAYAGSNDSSLINVGDQWSNHYSTGETVNDTMLRAESCGLSVTFVEQLQHKDATDTLWIDPYQGLIREVYTDSSGVSTYSYSPPVPGPSLPLVVGKQWWSNSTATRWFTPVNPIGFTSYDKPQTFHLADLHKVVAEENRTVGAGRFLSYRIDVYDGSGQLTNRDWLSLQARTVIYREELNSDGSIRYTVEVTSFSSGSGLHPKGTLSTLALCPTLLDVSNSPLTFLAGVVVILVLAPVGVSLLLRKRRKY